MNEDTLHEKQELTAQNSSTTAENIAAWKSLLSSSEAKNFVSELITKSTVLFGQTKGQHILNTISNLSLMAVAFVCIGLLGYHKLVSEGTTGVLAGIIIGYFFKKDD